MKRLRVGIFGYGPRGSQLAQTFMFANCDVVAVCDQRECCRENAKKELGSDIAIYKDFDSFIEHDMDAVVLANYFHEHAQFAIRCFEKDLHVAFLLLLLAVVAFECALLLVHHVEVGVHGLVVADALGVAAAYYAMQLVGDDHLQRVAAVIGLVIVNMHLLLGRNRLQAAGRKKQKDSSKRQAESA